jgi:hypothetical protein
MFFTAASIPGDPAVPNEDWVSVTSDAIVMLDGATIRTETGCEHGAAWFARELGSELSVRASRAHSLKTALATSINQVAQWHGRTCDLDHPGTPSAAVAVIQRTDAGLRYLVLGDITVVIETPDELLTVADHRISASAAAERAEADRYPIGSEQKAAALVAMKHVELAARGREYWVAAADPTAAYHALTGEIANPSRIAVLTDGAARYVDLFKLAGWESVLRILGTSGPAWYIDKMIRKIEAADLRGVRYPRNKRSDDASVIYALPNGPVSPPDVPLDDVNPARAQELIDRLDDPDLYGDGNRKRVLAERQAAAQR